MFYHLSLSPSPLNLCRLLHHFRGHKNVCTRLLTGSYMILTFVQITCLYDMDIVFQPNGNFDEVYLYVRRLSLLINI